MFNLHLILVLFLWSLNVMAQNTEISWSAHNKLKWSDFKGEVKNDSPFAAATFSGTTYRYSASVIGGKVKARFRIQSFFDTNQSWVKLNESDDYLLAHEQLHFDITELYTRKFRLKLHSMSFSENIKSEVRGVYDSINNLKRLRQELYDKETNHSKNKTAQLEWNKTIYLELQELEDFAADKQ